MTITAPGSHTRQTGTRTAHANARLSPHPAPGVTAATESRPKPAAARPSTSTARHSSRLLASPAVRFMIVGGASTLGYLALYALLRLALPSQVANMVALLATGDVNTVLNRRWAFRMKGPVRHRERAKGVVAYLVNLVATSTALALLDVLGAQGSTAELTALLIANALAGIVHYVLLRTWAFHPRDQASVCGGNGRRNSASRRPRGRPRPPRAPTWQERAEHRDKQKQPHDRPAGDPGAPAGGGVRGCAAGCAFGQHGDRRDHPHHRMIVVSRR